MRSLPSSEPQSDEELANRRRRHLIARCWRQADVPARFDECRLETSPHHGLAADLARADQGASYYLYGPVGTGKTGLAAGYLRTWIERTLRPALFVTAPRMFSELRSTYNGAELSEIAIIDRYAQIPLLVLDDLGSEGFKSQDWLSDRLYQILGERHDELLPTVITSNLSLHELSDRVGERITWRIAEACGPGNIIQVKGRNLREPQ